MNGKSLKCWHDGTDYATIKAVTLWGRGGKVHFIDADPKAYHPGRGVYRSSARNAQRLARTEINMAYHKAEQERWKSFDFVVGYEWHLSQAVSILPS